jgi:hypothetical protein
MLIGITETETAAAVRLVPTIREIGEGPQEGVDVRRRPRIMSERIAEVIEGLEEICQRKTRPT